MRRSKGSNHTAARRVVMASMTVLTASGIGLVAAPMAFGQIVLPVSVTNQGIGVTNSGSASANTGGNNAVGNASTNNASTSTSAGLVNLPIAVGAPSNTSQGTATVNTGPANAVGNTSDTGVAQSNASGTQVNSFLSGQSQSASVDNAGSASANTGGNNAIGNASQNTAAVNQNVSGGLLGVGVNIGGPTNNSSGTATINTGAANAAGNVSSTDVNQATLGGGGGIGHGAGPCGTGRFASFQNADVSNRGQASANTGDNTAIGNASTNDASVTTNQTVSGALLGVGLNIGGPVNNSSGTAVINTGPATAVGNDSSTTVSQVQGCPQVTTLTAAPGHQVVVTPHGRLREVRTTLARTGLDTGDLGMIAGALLGAGMLLIASQRRRLAARHATVPMAGFGFGLGADDWDRAVR